LANGSGNNNTATGAGALLNNTIGAGNNANGAFALFNNSTGSGNIAIGYQAGLSLTTGNNNIDIGNIGITGELYGGVAPQRATCKMQSCFLDGWGG